MWSFQAPDICKQNKKKKKIEERKIARNKDHL